MRIAVLGTGVVGRTIGSRLIELEHQVVMGSRTADNLTAGEWVAGAGVGASNGTYADAAAAGELIVNCTAGSGSLEALTAVGADRLNDKVLVDVANPLDFARGMPPSLLVCNTDSLGEQIQRAFPELRVVKSLNTMNAAVMVDASRVPGEHDVFMSGNDAEAKIDVRALLRSFGWPDDRIVDLGDITTARGVEMFVPFWVMLYQVLGTGDFNIGIVR